MHPQGLRRILIDAVPMIALNIAWQQQQQFEQRKPVPFLLLQVDAALPGAMNLLNETGWIKLTLTEPGPSISGIPATAITWEGNANEDRGQEPVETLNLIVINWAPAASNLVEYTSALWPDFSKIARIPPASGRSTPCAMGVYDVGQAAFGAIVDDFEHPTAYLDMGWPLGFNRKSLPVIPHFKIFGTPGENEAPVILSHLDWDHWGFAIERGTASFDRQLLAWVTDPKYRSAVIRRPWYMRQPQYLRHNLGPSHAHLVQTLGGTTKSGGGLDVLHFYDESLPYMATDDLILIRCDAVAGTNDPAYLRNNEGLAVLLITAEDARFLYCGDADYPSIAACFLKKLDGIVAPHHGGAITYAAMPAPAQPGSKMVVSSGDWCYSSMPDMTTQFVALAQGWDWVETNQRRKCTSGGCYRGNAVMFAGLKPQCGCGEVPASCLCLQ